jgi:hypothetical protein
VRYNNYEVDLYLLSQDYGQNFTDFIRDSDNYPNAEYHAWRVLTPAEEEREKEAEAEMVLLC